MDIPLSRLFLHTIVESSTSGVAALQTMQLQHDAETIQILHRRTTRPMSPVQDLTGGGSCATRRDHAGHMLYMFVVSAYTDKTDTTRSRS